MTNDLHHTATHEAGHAVIGRVLGLVSGYATIVADGDSAGHHIIAEPWTIQAAWENSGKFRDVRSVLIGRILAFMAGAEAELALHGECSGGDGDDRWQIALTLDAMGAGQDEKFEPRLRRAAAYLVRKHQTSIVKVRDALLARQRLEGDDIAEIVPVHVVARELPFWMVEDVA